MFSFNTRRAFRVLAALAFCIGIAQAQVPLTGAGKGAPGGGGFTPSCTESGTFLTAATGVTLTADKTNYDTLICGLVSDGVWNFDVLYIWAAPTQATALINLANPGTFNGTTSGGVTFTAYEGFTGNGGGAADFYINSGFNPSTASSPKFVQNSATVGVYVLNARVTGNFWEVGCTSIPAGCGTNGLIFSPYALGNISAFLNSTSSAGADSPASSQGAWNLTRTTSSFSSVFLNSNTEEETNGPDTSQAPVNANIVFFALLDIFGFTPDQMAAGWIGAGVGDHGPGSGTSSCKVNNRINTYMASLAVPKNVYSNSAC